SANGPRQRPFFSGSASSCRDRDSRRHADTPWTREGTARFPARTVKSSMAPRRIHILAGMLLLACVGGCSQTRFAYEHLDLYARWRAHEYVSLKTAQSEEFKREFAVLWRWH